MGHEGRAQTCAQDEIVPERLKPHGILERGSLRRRRLHPGHSESAEPVQKGQNSRACWRPSLRASPEMAEMAASAMTAEQIAELMFSAQAVARRRDAHASGRVRPDAKWSNEYWLCQQLDQMNASGELSAAGLAPPPASGPLPLPFLQSKVNAWIAEVQGAQHGS